MTTAERRLRWLERRGRGLREFIARVAERGDRAETEEEDLAVLRLEWAATKAAARAAPRSS
jgi:hypothetical protein